MPGFRISVLRCYAVATVLLAAAFLCCPPRAESQTSDKPTTGAQTEAPFQLNVASNLVVVRVVVRDAQGKPVEGLRKEDFKVFDRGDEQTITQFEVETSFASPSNPAPVRGPGQAASPAMPGKFLALYFDDLNTSDNDMIQARDAVDHYLAANLQPKDRIAIFTSGEMLSDFTADPKQIHDALFKLHASPRSLTRGRECPELSDYQALQITEFPDDTMIDAWKVAMDEAANNRMCQVPPDPDSIHNYILMLARNIVAQAQIQAQSGLQALDQVVSYLSQMPGQRTIILVSPGFMSQDEQYQLDRIVDHALRSQVVISSLDPKGLALLMREVDVSKSYAPSASSGVIGAMHSVDTNREMVASDVLAEVAEGTGGEFFHNDNDLKAGFGALAGSSVYYILAFAPSDVKQDGKFHALKVTLVEKQKGLSLQARRGYFAPKEGAVAEVPPQPDTRPQASATTTDAEAQEKEKIREAVLSKADVQELPVEVRTEVSSGAGSNELAVLAHLDTKSLHFHKQGERNQNTVTFVSVVFDGGGKYVTGQQRQAKVDLPDAALSNLLATGMDVKVTFQLKPGTYKIREVVTDSEEHEMTSSSHNITIP